MTCRAVFESPCRSTMHSRPASALSSPNHLVDVERFAGGTGEETLCLVDHSSQTDGRDVGAPTPQRVRLTLVPGVAHPLLQAVEVIQHREQFVNVTWLVDVFLPVPKGDIEDSLLRLGEPRKDARELVHVEMVQLKREPLVPAGVFLVEAADLRCVDLDPRRP